MRILLLALIALIFSTPTFSSFAAALQDHSEHQHQSQHDSDKSPFDAGTEYVCPMHSQIVKDEPGTCPICGMDLVEREKKQEPQMAEDGHSGHDMSAMSSQKSFHVPKAQQQAIRVTTAKATRKDLQPMLKAQAQVRWQQSAKYHVHSRAEGWVEELYADVEGQWVEQGEKLYRVYAPDLVVAQDDYLQLLNSLNEVGNSESQRQFKRRGKQRLLLLGMNEQQISELEKTRQASYEVDYYAPQSGYVTELNIQQGMYVSPGLELMTITDDQQLWFMLDIPVRYADQLSTGQMVHLSSDQVSGHWMNKIDYVYPQVDPQTQTLTARVPIDSSIDSLREGLWATGHVELSPVKNALVVPVKSLITTAKNNRVLVQVGEQAFAVREVKTGLRVDDEVVITDGLSEGERVVTNGQFLLDSEASLRGMQPDGEKAPAMSHEHGGH
ncbi:efflux RND transporter periplasmic adaptor subunit [Idiomarina piscisalsi]|uniref:efflux RND transporter periplasmic adaptor subunit n=1 Tax=Idiomarina piscisalsi TaxID=1096243 RepID=UPI0026F08966|nr:efflux RND transporter periplasmic adaptor subunit [Idiomarina piscisalsi]